MEFRIFEKFNELLKNAAKIYWHIAKSIIQIRIRMYLIITIT